MGPIATIPIPKFIDQGGETMIVLIVCALVALTVILERTLFWLIEARQRRPKTVERMVAASQSGDFTTAIKTGAGSKDYVARVLTYGLTHRDASVTDSLELAGAKELKRMKRFLPVLDTIITVAPLLGILGTVIGIIESFDILGAAEIHDPRSVVGGIAKALSTTVAGLVVSIAALVPYNVFLSLVEGAVDEINHRGTQLEILVKKRSGDEG